MNDHKIMKILQMCSTDIYLEEEEFSIRRTEETFPAFI